MPLAIESPVGPHEGVPPAFVWCTSEVPPPYALVILDDAYTEVARIDDIGPTRYVPSSDLAGQLATAGECHWYVEGRLDGRPARSPLIRLEIR